MTAGGLEVALLVEDLSIAVDLGALSIVRIKGDVLVLHF
jgi:hypothetical protein